VFVRGPDPRDGAAFASKALPRLREAVADLSWLLGRGYSTKAAAKLVGDRLQLSHRQRHAMVRAAVSASSCDVRAAARVPRDVRPRVLWVDGFNVLVTTERLLGGAVVMRCRDDVLRDIGGVHGTYRTSDLTRQALARIAAAMPGVQMRWLFDAPVSNSGRACAAVRAYAAAHGLPWEAEAVASPDGMLPDAPCAATGDGPVIERSTSWLDLPARAVPEGAVVDLSGATFDDFGNRDAGC
jgi:hypothetical protein